MTEILLTGPLNLTIIEKLKNYQDVIVKDGLLELNAFFYASAETMHNILCFYRGTVFNPL